MIKYIKDKLQVHNLSYFISNYFSFSLQVLLGFLIFTVIYYRKGANELGIFIQSYTFFVLLGQLSVIGINESVLQKISSKNKEKNIFLNAFISVIFFLILFCIILYNFFPLIVGFFKSEELFYSNSYLYLAIFFFGLNKLAFSYFIANKKLNYFAFLNFLRPFNLSLLIIFNIFYIEAINYSFLFLLAETFLFIISYLIIIKIEKLNELKISFLNIINHYKFGLKVFINSFLNESFIRIDILIVGLLLSDREVGIYGLAALFLEGVYQFAIVIRNIINPEIGYLYSAKNYRAIVKLSKKYSLICLLIIVSISSLVILSFDYLLIFVNEFELSSAKGILIILLFGLSFYALIIPLENLLFQANQPIYQSIYMLLMTTLNIILNIIFIQQYGLIGAAIATSLTYISSIFLFNLVVIIATKLKYGIFFYYNKNIQ